jgi:hypothetical protein
MPSLRRIQSSYQSRNEGCDRDCRYCWLRNAISGGVARAVKDLISFIMAMRLSQSGRIDIGTTSGRF